MTMVTKFETFLNKQNLSKNTISAYLWTVNYYLKHYGEIRKKNLLAYKGYLVDNYKPQTVNLRLLGLNKYLEFIKMDKFKLKLVKMQQRNFLENVISQADYLFLKARLKADGYSDWYLPTADELNLVYMNLRKIGKISGNSIHWSSSMYPDGDVKTQRFSDGYQSYTENKNTALSVRAIRVFNY